MISAHPYVPCSPLAFSNSTVYICIYSAVHAHKQSKWCYTLVLLLGFSNSHIHTHPPPHPLHTRPAACNHHPSLLSSTLPSSQLNSHQEAASSPSIVEKLIITTPFSAHRRCNSPLCSRTSSRTKLLPKTQLHLLPSPFTNVVIPTSFFI
jgi:hypothetical protein